MERNASRELMPLHPLLSILELATAAIIFSPFLEAAVIFSMPDGSILWYESSLCSPSSLNMNMSRVSQSGSCPDTESSSLIMTGISSAPLSAVSHEWKKTGRNISKAYAERILQSDRDRKWNFRSFVVCLSVSVIVVSPCQCLSPRLCRQIYVGIFYVLSYFKIKT